jgi:cytochrome c6
MKVLSIMLVCVLAAVLSPSVFAAEDGPAIYKAKCALCHAADGGGDTPMGRKLGLQALGSDDVQKMSDDDIRQTIVQGKGKMPGFENKLTSDQVQAVIAHVRSFGKK